MKNIFTLMLLCVTVLLGSCSKDDNSPMITPEELNKNFGVTDGTKLTLTYSDEVLIGKTVDFHTNDSQKAMIALNDIIPGETQTVINDIQLIESENKYTFSGNVAATPSTGAAVAYSGSVSGTELTLNVNVTMPQNARTYTLAQLELGDESYWMYSRKGLKPPYTYTYKEMTRTNTVVTSAGYVAITHSLPTAADATAQDTINACSITTFTDKFRSALGCMFPQVLQSISLEKDGNVTAKYSSGPVRFDQAYLLNPQQVTPETIAELISGRTWTASPKNLAYWFEKDGKIYIKLNVGAILNQATGGSNETIDMSVINSILQSNPASIKQLLSGLNLGITQALAGMSDETFTMLLDWVNHGIPVKIRNANGHAYLYLDREILDPILSEIPALLPVIEDLIPEESRDLAMSTVNNILKGYQYTAKFEVGLDLVAQ